MRMPDEYINKGSERQVAYSTSVLSHDISMSCKLNLGKYQLESVPVAAIDTHTRYT